MWCFVIAARAKTSAHAFLQVDQLLGIDQKSPEKMDTDPGSEMSLFLLEPEGHGGGTL